MLQFNTTSPNKNAIYLDTVNTGSGYYDTLRIAYSQSYDQSSGTFEVTADSLPSAYRNWLTISNLGPAIPTPTGLYDVELYTAATTTQEVTWVQAINLWKDETDQWNSVGEEAVTLQDLLYSDRAFISSSTTDTTTYLSPNENGKYTTYNG